MRWLVNYLGISDRILVVRMIGEWIGLTQYGEIRDKISKIGGICSDKKLF